MTTPPKTSYIHEQSPPRIHPQSPPRPQTNPKDALICWLKEVKDIAPFATSEGWSDYSTLANTVPASAIVSVAASEVVEIVKKVAATKQFNPDLERKVDAVLDQLGALRI